MSKPNDYMTAAFQAVLADIATNEQKAKRYLGQCGSELLPEQHQACKESLAALSPTARKRVTLLASLLSERRFKRIANLLPASREMLGDNFSHPWQSYQQSAPPGMPSATEEAVSYANFLQKSARENSLLKDVLRYEAGLNEVSRRLLHRDEKSDTQMQARPLALRDCVSLCPYALVETFSHDVITAVKQLRAGESVASEQQTSQSVIFRPKEESGLAVDVSIIPNKLASVLGRAYKAAPVAALVRGEAAEVQASLMPMLDYLMRAGVLRLSPSMVLVT
ncbi:hypothetical protein [Thalassomonas actiniarum]|uniref:Uncharacterized protein n=1 Tax=Thalassomonas actiniarum TaxID=485447 RepID=A0AAF0C4G2_9GAMM|nr:hypothetical protein [Thalassomonas actiniarum]WDE02277.1 hypothetical protein SG35_031480 [Thalassomonas actiniarum]